MINWESALYITEVPLFRTAIYGIFDKILLVRACPGWGGFGADLEKLVQIQCVADLVV